MNRKTYAEKHPLITSILYSLLILLFPVAAGVITTISKSDSTQLKLVQGICFMLAVIIALLIMKKSKYSFKEYGFDRQTANGNRHALWYIPMVLVELTALSYGFGEQNTPLYVLTVLFMTAMVGIAEEAFYRGLMLKTWSHKGDKYAIVVGSIFFGITHLGNLFGGADLINTIMQVFFAALFGFVCAELVVVTKSLVGPIFFHFLHDFIAYTGPQNENINYLIITGIQVIILVSYAVYLWKKIGRLSTSDCLSSK